MMIGEIARPTMALMGKTLADNLGGGGSVVNPSVSLADQYFDASVESASLSGDGSLSLGGKIAVGIGAFLVVLYLTRK